MSEQLSERGKDLVKYMPQVVNALADRLIEKFEERILYGEKPQTNADRIRAMTDEELAVWLDDVCKSSYDEGYTKETEEPLMSDYPSIASEWAKWLKEDA